MAIDKADIAISAAIRPFIVMIVWMYVLLIQSGTFLWRTVNGEYVLSPTTYIRHMVYRTSLIRSQRSLSKSI